MRFVSHALLCACAIVVALFTHPAAAERRVALVVGDGAYKNTTVLPNPSADARAIAALLRNVGFDVVEGTDLGRDAMTGLLRDFAIKTQGADVALFFYAGHGIAVNGKNYLIPVDADLKSEMDVKFGATIDVDVTLDQTMADAKVKLVFLDACRDNPFANKIRSAARTRAVTVSSGLAEMRSGEGTLIAFATGPGRTALDGKQGDKQPFHAGVAKEHLGTGRRDPPRADQGACSGERRDEQAAVAVGDHLTGFFYMNQAPAAAPAVTASLGNPAAATASSNAGASNDIELELWRSVLTSDKVEELSAYLARYPNGNFATLARARIAALQAGATTRSTDDQQSVRTAAATQDTEDGLALDQRQRAEIQRRLAARKYPTSGYLNKLQHDALLVERLPPPRRRRLRRRTSRDRRRRRRDRRGPEAPVPANGPVPAHPTGQSVDPAGAAFMGGPWRRARRGIAPLNITPDGNAMP